MAIIWPLHAGVWIVALGVGLNVGNGQAHDVSKVLADLVLCHFVFARELERPGKRLAIPRVEVLGRHI